MDRIEEIRARLAKITPWPWRVRRNINNYRSDRTKITDVRYEIGAGSMTTPAQNKGHFHPDDEWYTLDEFYPVETSTDRDYGYYEGGIEKEDDAAFIAAAPEDVSFLLSQLEQANNVIRDIVTPEAFTDSETWHAAVATGRAFLTQK